MKRLAKRWFLVVLKEAAARLNIKLYELAKRAGIPRSSIYHYANNPTRLSIEKADEVRKLAGIGRDEWNQLIEKALKMKKLIVLVFLFCSLSAVRANAVDLECVGLTDSQCEAMRDCIATLGDFDPICVAFGLHVYAGNVCAEELSDKTDEVLARNDEVRKLSKRVKRLRNKAAELQK